MASTSQWQINNGELINPNNTKWIDNYMTPPYPNIYWKVKQNNQMEYINTKWIDNYMTLPYPNIYWTIKNDNELEHSNSNWLEDYMTIPYPNIYWIIKSNNKLEHNNNNWLKNYISTPYPNIYWTIKNNQMEHNQSFYYNYLGSFYNSTLSKVEIPTTATKIGERAFYNTKINTITLPKNCEYFPNSFPIDCKIIIN